MTVKESYESRDSMIGFVGFAKMTAESLSNEVSFKEGVTWGSYFYYREVGEFILYAIGWPSNYVDGRAMSCGSSNDDSFLTFADEFGIDNIITWDEYKDLVTENIEDDIDA